MPHEMPTRAPRKPKNQKGPPRYSKAIRDQVLELYYQGAMLAEIANKLGMTRAVVRQVVADPKVQAEYDRLRSERREAIERHLEQETVQAVRTLAKGMRGDLGAGEAYSHEKAREQRLCAESVLDRYGLPRKISVKSADGGGQVVAGPQGVPTLFDLVRGLQDSQ